jgi:hypothetical protein
MTDTLSSPFVTKTYSSVEEIGTKAWDELSAGRPFQSARWYQYGERVMEDCTPFHMIVYEKELAIARASFWLVRNEPLPVSPAQNKLLSPIFQRWPLLICRSPLSNSSGLILPEGPQREPALQLLLKEASRQARRMHCSFMVIDFLTGQQAASTKWPGGFVHTTGGDPGTILPVEWSSFEAYVSSRDSRNRRRIAYNRRKAAELSIQVVRCECASQVEDCLALIRRVEAKYQSPPNPWIGRMIANMQMVPSTFLEARIGAELVGCELILYDNGAQLPTGLGHSEAAVYDYLEMLYTNLEDAMEKGCRLLRWGSGSEEIKRHLGFEPEYTNHVVAGGIGWLAASLTHLAALFMHPPRGREE